MTSRLNNNSGGDYPSASQEPASGKRISLYPIFYLSYLPAYLASTRGPQEKRPRVITLIMTQSKMLERVKLLDQGSLDTAKPFRQFSDVGRGEKKHPLSHRQGRTFGLR